MGAQSHKESTEPINHALCDIHPDVLETFLGPHLRGFVRSPTGPARCKLLTEGVSEGMPMFENRVLGLSHLTWSALHSALLSTSLATDPNVTHHYSRRDDVTDSLGQEGKRSQIITCRHVRRWLSVPTSMTTSVFYCSKEAGNLIFYVKFSRWSMLPVMHIRF